MISIKKNVLYIFTWLIGMLGSDLPVATCAGLLFRDNNCSKIITHSIRLQPIILNIFFDKLNMSFYNMYDIIFTND